MAAVPAARAPAASAVSVASARGVRDRRSSSGGRRRPQRLPLHSGLHASRSRQRVTHGRGNRLAKKLYNRGFALRFQLTEWPMAYDAPGGGV
eukprot:222944-Prymnesium_polylepis.1